MVVIVPVLKIPALVPIELWGVLLLFAIFVVALKGVIRIVRRILK